MIWRGAHRSSGSERGEARGVLLAVMVTITAAAAAVALLVILINGSGSGSRSSGNGSVAAPPRQSGAAVRTSSPPTSAAPSTSSPRSTPATSTTSTAPRSSGSASHRPKPPLIYVVHRGDNLTVIAKWFHLHGYGALYERNRAVLGDNPNLIFPGQRITLSSSGMSMGSD